MGRTTGHLNPQQMTIGMFFDKKWPVSISKGTFDKVILLLAILGVLAGVAFTILIGSSFHLHNFRGSLLDEVFFLLLTSVGVYSLARFLIARIKSI